MTMLPDKAIDRIFQTGHSKWSQPLLDQNGSDRLRI